MSQPASAAIRAARLACPYLQAHDGQRAWHAGRDAFCAAAGTRAHVQRDRQAGICLADGHERCETYRAAQALDGRRPEWDGTRRRIASTAPLVISEATAAVPESVARSIPAPLTRVFRSQRVYQATVAVLMVIAFALLGARLVSPWLAPQAATSSGTPPASSASAPIPTPSSSAAMPSGSAASSASPTAATSATTAATSAPPSATARTDMQTYVVREGDSLSSIAPRFGTTVAALREANDLAPGAILHPGDILYIPR